MNGETLNITTNSEVSGRRLTVLSNFNLKYLRLKYGDILVESENYLNARNEYASIKLPKRATIDSAGYDFYAPFDFTLKPGESIKIPTGIRVALPKGMFLMVVPRSGLGIKRLIIKNTLPIIDGDYFYSDNEGHIFINLMNDNSDGLPIEVKKGKAFVQGIILLYCITEDDDTTATRNGGFGSTDKK